MVAVEIPLTRGKVALVSPEDAERVLQHKWQAAPRKNGIWYAKAGKWNGLSVDYFSMHRFILRAPQGLHVDHIDDDGLNNTRENLRLCTGAQNIANKRSGPNKTGYRGVWYNARHKTRPYVAALKVLGRRVYVGGYPTPEEAARAYDRAALEHFGEFARLNFPEAA